MRVTSAVTTGRVNGGTCCLHAMKMHFKLEGVCILQRLKTSHRRPMIVRNGPGALARLIHAKASSILGKLESEGRKYIPEGIIEQYKDPGPRESAF
jgi:hypothetical protein